MALVFEERVNGKKKHTPSYNFLFQKKSGVVCIFSIFPSAYNSINIPKQASPGSKTADMSD